MEDIINTWGGQPFDFINPQPTSIFIEDIAHALSLQCRFNGHCDKFYSVAEHSIEVCRLVESRGYSLVVIMTALLHDAAEAYIGDIVSPLKKRLPDYREIERGIEKAVADKFSIQYPFPKEVHKADKDILELEFASLKPFSEKPSDLLRCMPPEMAEAEFLAEFRRLRSLG